MPGFSPPTYEAGGGLPEPKPGKAECPSCKLRVAFVRLADVSMFPEVLTRGIRWACDGCRERWVRQAANMGRGKGATHAEFARLWNAPANHVQKLEQAHAKRLERKPALKAKHDRLKGIFDQRVGLGLENAPD